MSLSASSVVARCAMEASFFIGTTWSVFDDSVPEIELAKPQAETNQRYCYFKASEWERNGAVKITQSKDTLKIVYATKSESILIYVFKSPPFMNEVLQAFPKSMFVEGAFENDS